MREKRLYVECDRCHTAITVKRDPNGGTISQGGYLDFYESLPEGWESIDGKDFCPDCARKYHNLMENFYGK